jgi:hypothetical protein
MQTGWIKLHRSILDWEWYDDTNAVRLFLHLLLTVNYEPKNWRGIAINSGQIITSHENLGKQCGLGVQQIRTAINKLKSTGELTSQSTNNYTLITITNWQKYQDDNKPDNNPITDEQQTDNKRITTTKEVNKERSKESVSPIIPLPDWMPLQAWQDYKDMRKQKKSIMTARAEQLCIEKLDKWRMQGSDPAEVLNYSTINGYTGIFEQKDNNYGKSNNAKQTWTDAGQQLAAKYEKEAQRLREDEAIEHIAEPVLRITENIR